MSNSLLTRLIVSAIVVIAFWVGMMFDRRSSGCRTDCPTDISASRR
jgi:hypothetical protein